MTPAALGAMLDGVPNFEFDDEEPAPVARPVPKAAPKAEAAPAESPAPVDQTSTAPAVSPAMPEAEQTPARPTASQSTGPVFETVVMGVDGSTDKPTESAPAKKGWWRR
jgi:ribonuclease E